MSDIRRVIRNTARGGNFQYGIVESLDIGLATVMVGGKRMTNLPVVGRYIQVGDTVIVDFVGSGPVVRPVLDSQLPADAALNLAVESIVPGLSDLLVDRADVGFHASNELFNASNSWFVIPYATPTIMPIEESANNNYPVMWDTHSHIRIYDEWAVVQTDGRYLATIEAYFHHDHSQDSLTTPGYCRVRLLQNGSPILIAQGRPGEEYRSGQYPASNLTATGIVALMEEDMISLELYHTMTNPSDADASTYGYSTNAIALNSVAEDFFNQGSGNASMQLQLIPGAPVEIELGGTPCMDGNSWTVPTDISEEEAEQLCVLYHMMDGDNMVWAFSGDDWGSSVTAGDWRGIDVSDGHVTSITVYFDSGTGNAVFTDDFDPSVFVACTEILLYLDELDTASGTIDYQWNDVLEFLYVVNFSYGDDPTVDITVDFATMNMPTNIYQLNFWDDSDYRGFTYTGLPSSGKYHPDIWKIEISNGQVPSTSYVDDWLELFYNDWANWDRSSPTSKVNVYFNGLLYGATPVTYNGTYQDANPPTTGREFEYKLENDPDTTGNNLFFISSSST